MGDGMPPDPLTELAAVANQLLLYESLVAAGFAESQAMQIVCALVTSGHTAGGS